MRYDNNMHGKISYTKQQWLDYATKQKEIAYIKARKPKIGFLVPSINNYYGYRGIKSGNRVFVKKFLFPESRVYLRFLSLLAKKNIATMVPCGIQCELKVIMYYSKKPRVDVDNPKAIMDALKGVLFEDDSQVFKLTTIKRLKAGKDKVIISWKPYLDSKKKERKY